MPTPYHTLSDDTLNLLAERGNAQALMELAHRAERLGILAEAQELANRLRKGSTLIERLSAEAQKYATAGPPHIRDLLLEAEGEMTELIEALERIADPNKLDARDAPMPAKDARLALSWLSARPEFKAARETLARLREGSKDEKEDA